MATLWQRGALWINQWRNSPSELLAPYRGWGYRTVHLKLDHQDDGQPVPWSYCEQLRSAGFAVLGAFWANAEAPEAQAQWAVAEGKRLVLPGLVCNAEDEIEGLDAAGARWSERFCKEYRRLAPTRGLAINTYTGCGYIDHAAWRAAKARLYMQTFPGSGFGFSEDVPYVTAKAVEWGWRRPFVKPCFGVYKYLGERPDPAVMVASAYAAKSVGFVAYYADGTFDEPEYMQALAQGIGPTGIAR